MWNNLPQCSKQEVEKMLAICGAVSIDWHRCQLFVSILVLWYDGSFCKNFEDKILIGLFMLKQINCVWMSNSATYYYLLPLCSVVL